MRYYPGLGIGHWPAQGIGHWPAQGIGHTSPRLKTVIAQYDLLKLSVVGCVTRLILVAGRELFLATHPTLTKIIQSKID